MPTRRTFLGTAVAAGVYPRLSPAASREVEARIARRDFRGLTKEDLGTPAMILDLALFEKNVRKMAEHAKSTGLQLRPHVKIHKSPEISKRQLKLGALGVTCATIAECEWMNANGIRGVLHTCQPAGRNKITRAAALAKKDPTFTCVVDDPRIADQLNEAAGAAGTRMNVAVDVYAGLTRQGIEPGAKALALAQKVSSSKNLRLAGLMAYSGNASHTKIWNARKKRSEDDLAGMLETAEMCKRSGLPVEIRTGGSTGTYNIDSAMLTELQCGSYVFMDTLYRRIGGKSSDTVYEDFEPALTVMTTVVSQTRPGMATIDAGNKAMLRVTDEVKGRSDVKIENQGAEYGMLLWKEGRDITVGDRVEIYPSNLDTSTNVYDRYYVAQGDSIVDAWPIMGRSGPAQR